MQDTKAVTVSLTREQREYINTKGRAFNFSGFVQEKIEEEMVK